MTEKDNPSFLSTETIDLNNLFTRDVTSSGSFDVGGTLTTSLGKLLQTIPIPTMLVDGACSIVFANEAFRKLSPGGENFQLGSFAGLFPDAEAAASVDAAIKEVFSTRRPSTKEYAMKIGTRRIFGRLHLRPLRVGRRRTVLVIVEDLTLEHRGQSRDKKQPPRTERAHGSPEQRLQVRTAQLRIARERLRKEISERKKAQNLLDQLAQEFGQEAIQRIAMQIHADEELRTPKAAKKRQGGLASSEDSAQTPIAGVRRTGEKSKNIFQELACSANAALGDLAAGDVGGARDKLERILDDCRASGRAIHSIKPRRH